MKSDPSKTRAEALHIAGNPLKSEEAVARFVAENGIVLLTAGKLSLPGLADAIAGEPIRGSWWGHPKGKAIFNLVENYGDRNESVSLPLVAGRVTFVHNDLLPALAGALLDREFRDRALRALSKGARALLARVEAEGALRLDLAGIPPADGKELRSALLVHSESVHTESGKHATRVAPWPAVLGKTKPLAPDQARLALMRAALRASRISPEKEALSWFPWPREQSGAAIKELTPERSGKLLSLR